MLDSVQCSWRKEERLIDDSGLGGIIYELAYSRYAKKHDVAKEALLKISYYKSDQKILGEIKRFLVEKQEIHNHTHRK